MINNDDDHDDGDIGIHRKKIQMMLFFVAVSVYSCIGSNFNNMMYIACPSSAFIIMII